MYQVSILVFSFILATPSAWRSEFIVMVTAVCIIHAGVVVMLMTSSLQEKSWVRPTQLFQLSIFVGLCYRYWRRPCYRRHTRQLFVCGLAHFDCIMYNKISDKPKITATRNHLKWHWTVKQRNRNQWSDTGAIDLFMAESQVYPSSSLTVAFHVSQYWVY